MEVIWNRHVSGARCQTDFRSSKSGRATDQTVVDSLLCSVETRALPRHQCSDFQGIFIHSQALIVQDGPLASLFGVS
jgi:hypothetical protein